MVQDILIYLLQQKKIPVEMVVRYCNEKRKMQLNICLKEKSILLALFQLAKNSPRSKNKSNGPS